MLYLNEAVPKPAIRRASDAMVQAFLAKGGKVRRVPCTGKTPTFSKTGCDPRTRPMFLPGNAVRGRGLTAR